MKALAWTSLALVSTLLLGAHAGLSDSERVPFSPDSTSGFTVALKGERFHQRLGSIFAMPGDVVEAEIGAPSGGAFEILAERGEILRRGARSWSWRAPREPGLYRLRLRRVGTTEVMELNAFVMVPAAEVRDGLLQGYRIGSYPSPDEARRKLYPMPQGFLEVTEENQEELLAPHFRLKQFLCKQEGEFPKYVVLKEKLVLKLEYLLGEVQRLGYQVPTFHVMSGYRTPWYNRSIGNVPYSRHVWGDAADIFIDTDLDGMMDDLNGDGRSGADDARILYRIVDREDRAGIFGLRSLLGGLSSYPATDSHGPFVHVDARGRLARW